MAKAACQIGRGGADHSSIGSRLHGLHSLTMDPPLPSMIPSSIRNRGGGIPSSSTKLPTSFIPLHPQLDPPPTSIQQPSWSSIYPPSAIPQKYQSPPITGASSSPPATASNGQSALPWVSMGDIVNATTKPNAASSIPLSTKSSITTPLSLSARLKQPQPSLFPSSRATTTTPTQSTPMDDLRESLRRIKANLATDQHALKSSAAPPPRISESKKLINDEKVKTKIEEAKAAGRDGIVDGEKIAAIILRRAEGKQMQDDIRQHVDAGGESSKKIRLLFILMTWMLEIGKSDVRTRELLAEATERRTKRMEDLDRIKRISMTRQLEREHLERAAAERLDANKRATALNEIEKQRKELELRHEREQAWNTWAQEKREWEARMALEREKMTRLERDIRHGHTPTPSSSLLPVLISPPPPMPPSLDQPISHHHGHQPSFSDAVNRHAPPEPLVPGAVVPPLPIVSPDSSFFGYTPRPTLFRDATPIASTNATVDSLSISRSLTHGPPQSTSFALTPFLGPSNSPPLQAPSSVRTIGSVSTIPPSNTTAPTRLLQFSNSPYPSSTSAPSSPTQRQLPIDYSSHSHANNLSNAIDVTLSPPSTPGSVVSTRHHPPNHTTSGMPSPAVSRTGTMPFSLSNSAVNTPIAHRSAVGSKDHSLILASPVIDASPSLPQPRQQRLTDLLNSSNADLFEEPTDNLDESIEEGLVTPLTPPRANYQHSSSTPATIGRSRTNRQPSSGSFAPGVASTSSGLNVNAASRRTPSSSSVSLLTSSAQPVLSSKPQDGNKVGGLNHSRMSQSGGSSDSGTNTSTMTVGRHRANTSSGSGNNAPNARVSPMLVHPVAAVEARRLSGGANSSIAPIPVPERGERKRRNSVFDEDDDGDSPHHKDHHDHPATAAARAFAPSMDEQSILASWRNADEHDAAYEREHGQISEGQYLTDSDVTMLNDSRSSGGGGMNVSSASLSSINASTARIHPAVPTPTKPHQQQRASSLNNQPNRGPPQSSINATQLSPVFDDSVDDPYGDPTPTSSRPNTAPSPGAVASPPLSASTSPQHLSPVALSRPPLPQSAAEPVPSSTSNRPPIAPASSTPLVAPRAFQSTMPPQPEEEEVDPYAWPPPQPK
jgi:hypothetical protein